MKKTTLSLITVLALCACEGNTSSKSDQTGFTGTDQAAAPPPALGRPEEAPQVGVAAGMAVRSPAQVSDAAEQASAANAASRDPLQYMTAGTTAPAMVIRTGQAFI